MGMAFAQYFKPRNLKVLVLGLDAAGKTTMLYRIKEGRSLPGSIQKKKRMIILPINA